jgi:uncharacterized membrane-anchored protein
MKNTIKGFIAGFVAASLVVGGAFATVNQYLLTPASYPIIVDGQELNDPNYPTLNYEGTTYLSLKKTAEALDADLNWNEEKRQVEINNKKQESTVITESKTEVEKGDTMQKEVFGEFKESADMYIEEVDGEQYMSIGAFSAYVIKEEDNYYIKLPNQNAIHVKSGTEPTEHSISNVYKRTLVKLSSLNLTAEVNGDTITVYYK